jgi:hypothetical protein
MKKLIITIGIVLGLYTSNTLDAQFFVRIRPMPPVVVGVRPPCPSSRHVWIEGEWRWNNRQRQYIWMNGYWVESRPGRIWIGGHWIDGPRGSRWIPGHWGRR